MGVIAETADRVAVMYAGRLVEIGPVRQIVTQPRHPYTAGLMRSIPAIGGPRDRLAQIEGSMPRPGRSPPGCAFHPRCPEAFAHCGSERPALTAVGESRTACWLHAREPATVAADHA
jgi:peptide/nickel transport system ATP-binding protein